MNAPRALALVILILLILSLACGLTPAADGGRAASSAQAPPATLLPKTSTTVPSPASAKPSPTIAPTETAPIASPSPFPERDLHVVADESGAIEATVPRAWGQTRTVPWTDDNGRMIGTTFMASADMERFLEWKAEGVSISVSRRLGVGYIQLLDEEYETYLDLCNDPFNTYWDFQNALYRGKYVVLDNCAQVDNSWLSILSVVSIADPQGYVVRVLAYDLPPIFGGDFRDIMMQFEVLPGSLP